MVHTSDDTNTFIEAAEDCNAEKGIEPPLKADKKSIARMDSKEYSEFKKILVLNIKR